MNSELIDQKAYEAKLLFINEYKERNLLFQEFWRDNKPFSIALEANWCYAILREHRFKHSFCLEVVYLYFKNRIFFNDVLEENLNFFISLILDTNLTPKEVLEQLKQEYFMVSCD